MAVRLVLRGHVEYEDESILRVGDPLQVIISGTIAGLERDEIDVTGYGDKEVQTMEGELELTLRIEKAELA